MTENGEAEIYGSDRCEPFRPAGRAGHRHPPGPSRPLFHFQEARQDGPPDPPAPHRPVRVFLLQGPQKNAGKRHGDHREGEGADGKDGGKGQG